MHKCQVEIQAEEFLKRTGTLTERPSGPTLDDVVEAQTKAKTAAEAARKLLDAFNNQ